MSKDNLLGLTEDEIRATMRDVMTRAEIHPAYIHAVDVCGFILTDDNEHLFDDEDLSRWEDALDAWFDDHPGAPPL